MAEADRSPTNHQHLAGTAHAARHRARQVRRWWRGSVVGVLLWRLRRYQRGGTVAVAANRRPIRSGLAPDGDSLPQTRELTESRRCAGSAALSWGGRRGARAGGASRRAGWYRRRGPGRRRVVASDAARSRPPCPHTAWMGARGRSADRGPSTHPIMGDEPECAASSRVVRFAAAQDRDHYTRHTIDDQLTAGNRVQVHRDQITAGKTASDDLLPAPSTPCRTTTGRGSYLAHHATSHAPAAISAAA